MDLQLPTAHRIDPLSGELSGHTGQYEKRLRELRDLYLDSEAFERELTRLGDPVVYRVQDVRPARRHGDLIFGITRMLPGRIGDEFYMTRGHIHAIANRPETYYGEYGRGLMLLESLEGETRVIEIAPRTLVYVPPLWIHRSVNTGSMPLVMSFCYPCDSGQDYAAIERTGGMAERILADGAGWKAVPNPVYVPRTQEDIARILATSDATNVA